MLAGRQAGRLAHDLVALDDEPAAVVVQDHPFAPEERDRTIRMVPNRDEVDERVRFSFRQTGAALVMNQSIKMGREARDFDGSGRHA